MRHSSTRSGLPAGNPIANVLVVIAGALIVGASIVLGFFAFLALSAIVLVAAAIIGIRSWWFQRRHRHEHGAPPSSGAGGVIEGEYRVVRKDRDEA